MANELFVDTSGFYSLLVKGDDRHRQSSDILAEAAGSGRGFVTTDYVLDETATLLKARNHAAVLRRFIDTVFGSSVCQVEWTDAQRFVAVQGYYLKHLDQAWSFTDCVSFRVMKDRRLREALTKDQHFQHAGYVALLT